MPQFQKKRSYSGFTFSQHAHTSFMWEDSFQYTFQRTLATKHGDLSSQALYYISQIHHNTWRWRPGKLPSCRALSEEAPLSHPAGSETRRRYLNTKYQLLLYQNTFCSLFFWPAGSGWYRSVDGEYRWEHHLSYCKCWTAAHGSLHCGAEGPQKLSSTHTYPSCHW